MGERSDTRRAGDHGETPVAGHDTQGEHLTGNASKQAVAMNEDMQRQVIVEALEEAAFRGEWGYDPALTALEAAIVTADLVVKAFTAASADDEPPT